MSNNAHSITLDNSHEIPSLPSFHWKGAKLLPTLFSVGIGVAIWQMTPPEGVSAQAWQLLAIFVATVVGVITKPLPMGAVAIVALAVCIISKTLTLEQSFSSFSSHVVWLVIFAFFIARGFIKTGLGARLAYFFVGTLGRSTLGLSYGLVLTELLLAPFIPSNTARGAGVIFPIVNSLAVEQGSSPEKHTQKKLGAFLIQVCFHGNTITSAMFMTALVGNPMIVSFAGSMGVKIDWLTWALAASVPGLINLAVLPWIIYKLYPPRQKYAADAAINAKQKLREMGALKIEEWLMLGTFVTVFCLWVFGEKIGIDPTTSGLVGGALLLSTGVLTWPDFIKEKGAWETLIWFATLLMMATFLGKLGLIKWFSVFMQQTVGHFHWVEALFVLGLVYFYVHYFFASITAHITALYGAFLTVLLAIGTPPMVAAMSLAVLSSLSGTLTHYGTGTAPVMFGSNYVPIGDWWRIGAIIGFINLVIWTVVGSVWWKILGYW